MVTTSAKRRVSNLRAVKKYRKTQAGRDLSVKMCRSYYQTGGGKEKQKLRNISLKSEVLSHYSLDNGLVACECCGEAILDFLTIDHKEGGGAKHRRSIGGGVVFYRWLKNNRYPKGYRVLCYNCNCASHLTGVCPHERQPS